MMKNKKVFFGYSLWIVLTLAACAAPVNNNEVATEGPVTEAELSETPMPTAAPTETLTPTNTMAPRETLTPTNTPMPTNTPTPTMAPQETLTPTPAIAAEKLAFMTDAAEDVRLPIISVYTENGAEILSREEYVNCVVDVFNTEDEFAMLEVEGGIRVRGNASAYYGDVDKIRKYGVPYRIKFSKKQNMLGLNDGAECKSWVLLRTGSDLIRNDLALSLGRTILSEDNYCSDSKFVYLYVNEVFQGVYLLAEQNQVNKNRVNVYEPEEGYTGTDIGYYVEMDNYALQEEHYFGMPYEGATVTDIQGVTRRFIYSSYSIKNDIYSEEQKTFIGSYMKNIFKLLYRAVEKDEYLTFNEDYTKLVESDYTNAKDAICAVYDIRSVVDVYILYEIVHDYDCGDGSFFFSVDFSEETVEPKLKFTSPWDFDWAYGDSPTDMYYAGAYCSEEFAEQYSDRSNVWFILFMKEDWFVEMVKERWAELQAEGSLMACVEAEREFIELYEKELTVSKSSAVKNAHSTLDWVEKRIAWLDEEWLPAE